MKICQGSRHRPIKTKLFVCIAIAVLLTIQLMLSLYGINLKILTRITEVYHSIKPNRADAVSQHYRSPPAGSIGKSIDGTGEPKPEAKLAFDTRKPVPGAKIAIETGKLVPEPKIAVNTVKPVPEGITRPKDPLCLEHFPYTNEIIQPKTPTNFSQWSFSERHNCPPFSIKTNMGTRQKVLLSCKEGQPPRMSTVMTSSSSDVMSVPHDDPCLKAFIQSCCLGDKLVPNVVSFVWTNPKEVGFFHFVSFMSALRFMKPCLFLFHGSLPHGEYWDRFISLAPNVILVNRTRVDTVYGQTLKFVEHSADVMRIEALMAFGGYYLDWDEILLRSVDDLRDYNCTLSQEIPNYLTIGFIMAAMNSTFLNLWHQGYRNYDHSWGKNSLMVPYQISKARPETVHIAGFRFARPNYQELDSIFLRNYNWSDNYGLHLYIRSYKKPADETIVRTLNTTLGAVCRHVLLGDKELCRQ